MDEDNNHIFFKKVLWTFKTYINGFCYKSLVQLDKIFLYEKSKGTLLVAVAQDGQNNIIPIVFTMVEGEMVYAWLF